MKRYVILLSISLLWVFSYPLIPLVFGEPSLVAEELVVTGEKFYERSPKS